MMHMRKNKYMFFVIYCLIERFLSSRLSLAAADTQPATSPIIIVFIIMSLSERNCTNGTD